jgi:aquaporin Z
MDDKNLRAYLIELIGTFAFVLVSAGTIYVNALLGVTSGALSVAVATGLIYAGALAVTVPISGGYLNPAIPIMLYVFKRMDGVRALGLVLVQVLGSALAGLVLYGLLNFRQDLLLASHVGAPQFNGDVFGYGVDGSVFVPLLKGIGVELVLTFILAVAILAFFFDPRLARRSVWASRLAYLWVGLTLAGLTYVGYGLTGAALNPARWLGPVLWDWINNSAAFHHNAIYWVGPTAGALLATWVYTALVLPPEESEQVAHQGAARSSSVPANVTSTLFRAKR